MCIVYVLFRIYNYYVLNLKEVKNTFFFNSNLGLCGWLSFQFQQPTLKN